MNEIDTIRTVLETRPFVRVAVVFGSVVFGRAGFDGDVDIAVASDAPLTATRREALIESVAVATGRPVDLVDLLADGGWCWDRLSPPDRSSCAATAGSGNE